MTRNGWRARGGVIALVGTAWGLSAGCGANEEDGATPVADAGGDRVRATPRPRDAGPDVALDAAPTDAAACNVRVERPPVLESPHVPEGSAVSYNSNPPSSGPHYGSWANFQEYAQPVDDRFLVHALEHGAVLLLYDCEGVACLPIVAALRKIREAIPTDPQCDPSIRVRVILAPRPANDDTIAASAWGATYRASCVDTNSLVRFVIDNYGKAPESFCTPGITF